MVVNVFMDRELSRSGSRPRTRVEYLCKFGGKANVASGYFWIFKCFKILLCEIVFFVEVLIKDVEYF